MGSIRIPTCLRHSPLTLSFVVNQHQLTLWSLDVCICTGNDNYCTNVYMKVHSDTDIGMFVSSVIMMEFIVRMEKQSPPAINLQIFQSSITQSFTQQLPLPHHMLDTAPNLSLISSTTDHPQNTSSHGPTSKLEQGLITALSGLHVVPSTCLA